MKIEPTRDLQSNRIDDQKANRARHVAELPQQVVKAILCVWDSCRRVAIRETAYISVSKASGVSLETPYQSEGLMGGATDLPSRPPT